MDVQPIGLWRCPECNADVSTEVTQACRAQEIGVREVFSTEVFEQVADAWATCANGHQNKYLCGLQGQKATA